MLVKQVSTQGLCIVACWTTCTVTTTLSSGFALSEHSGIVTKMSDDDTGSGRTIAEIDGEPAGAVYDRWSGGMIMGEAEFDDTGQANLLAASSFCPLGEIENSRESPMPRTWNAPLAQQQFPPPFCDPTQNM